MYVQRFNYINRMTTKQSVDATRRCLMRIRAISTYATWLTHHLALLFITTNFEEERYPEAAACCYRYSKLALSSNGHYDILLRSFLRQSIENINFCIFFFGNYLYKFLLDTCSLFGDGFTRTLISN